MRAEMKTRRWIVMGEPLNARVRICFSQHSPSNRHEPKAGREMLHLCRGKGFRKRIGDHLFGGAIYESKFPLFNDPTDKVIPNIDVFRACVVLMLLRERDRGLIVRKQSGGRQDSAEKLEDEGHQETCASLKCT
jgi:hypothetical protein